ncbi:PAS domain-containing protein [Hymenobacter sp. 5516J-16]|nr:PAS domain-containing protein [Hymenobacter sp. 5516J-16]UOQ75552.1 PAS domain-containing protein [Hymenobacter sp. 5516J-16]
MSSSSSSDSTIDAGTLADQLAQERRERMVAERQVQALRRHLTATQRVVGRLTGSITRLTQNLRVAVLVAHQNGKVVLLNQEFCDLFGLEDASSGMQEQPAEPLLEGLINQAARPEAMRQRLEAMRAVNQRVLGEDLELADSTVLEMDFIPLSGPDDLVPAGFMLSFRDVTQARRAEQYLNSLSRIPGQNPNPVLRLHANGRVLYANPAAEELRQEYLDPREEPAFSQNLYQAATSALAAGVSTQAEIGFADHCFQLAIVPFVHDQYVNLYFTDITQVKDAEKRLVEQQGFYETVLNQLPADVAVLDTQQRYRYVNPPPSGRQPCANGLLATTTLSTSSTGTARWNWPTGGVPFSSRPCSSAAWWPGKKPWIRPKGSACLCATCTPYLARKATCAWSLATGSILRSATKPRRKCGAVRPACRSSKTLYNR